MARDEVNVFQPVSFGKYLLVEKIGSGGMAEIFRAKTFGMHGFGKEFAIKKILPHLTNDDEFLSLFINEAKIAVNLQHANIVQVLDLGEIQTQCYIAMEYVHGRDLHQALARCASRGVRLPLKLALFTMLECLKGLDYAHRARSLDGTALQLVHCDVSPSNVLLSYAGDVKVTDFGVARATTHTISDRETLKGKVGYMSPEQVCGQPLDHRSDIFSAGIMLYEMLTLRRLFTGESELDVMLQIRDGEVAERLPGTEQLPVELRDILATALARAPQDRFESAGDFVHVIMDYMFRHDIRATGESLHRFLVRLFAKEYARHNAIRQADPSDAAAFPSVLSPSVARYRYREPSGAIVGPMSLDTLLTLLRYQNAAGAAVAVDDGAWQKPEEIADVRAELHLDTTAPPLERSSAAPNSDTMFGAVPAPRPSRGLALAAYDKSTTVTQLEAPPASALVEGIPSRGRLDDFSFAHLLFRTHTQGSTGRLQITSRAHNKDIFIEHGAPRYVSTDQPHELLGNFLVDQGVLSLEELHAALDELEAFGGRLGDLLVIHGYLHSHALFHYLSLQARDKLLDIFAWTDASFRWDTDATFAGEAYPLGINSLEIVIEGVRSKMSIEAIEAHFARWRGRPVLVDKRRLEGLQGLKLTASELAVAAVLRNGATLEELSAAVTAHRALPRAQILRVLFMMLTTDLLAIDGTGGRLHP